jgi:SAM-dependent methyltransferase
MSSHQHRSRKVGFVSVFVGGVDLQGSEALLAVSLKHVLADAPLADQFFFGDESMQVPLTGLRQRTRCDLAMYTVVPAADGGSKARFGQTTPRVEALLVTRRAIECFLESSVPSNGDGMQAAAVLLRAHGYAVESLIATGTTVSQPSVRKSVPLKIRDSNLHKRAKQITKQHHQDQTIWAQRSPAFAGQAPVAGSTYAGGQELNSLSKAPRFHRWMASMLRPAFGESASPKVLEVGAGIGTMTKALAATYPNAKILSIEPDDGLSDLLNERVAASGVDTAAVSTHEITELAEFDTVLYVNVLEHIEDHVGELKRAYELLKPGGCVGVIVPAIPSLYGSLDAKTGHFRRYKKEVLRSTAVAAGFQVTELYYFDAVGVIPYWATIKVGAMPALSDRTTFLFDNGLVPLSKVAHKVWKQIPIGKNLLLVGCKPLTKV